MIRSCVLALFHKKAITCIVISCLLFPVFARAEISHALSMVHGAVLPENFESFPYANVNAPKGGTLVLGQIGGFDTLNPFTVKGNVATGIRDYTFDSLMARNWDEPFSLYPLVAKAVDLSADRKKITFFINEMASFSDGKPLTAKDVLFTFNLLKTKGKPSFRSRYGTILNVSLMDDYTISFDMTGEDKELPLILAIMPVLPEHILKDVDFEKSGITALVGSGPYKISKADMGRSLELTKRGDYWAEHLPVNKGRFNFDRIRYDYYGNQNTVFEALGAGNMDIFIENNPLRWKQGYSFVDYDSSLFKRASLPHDRPSGLFAMVMNMRRQVFQDENVRQAFQIVFPFDDINKRFYNNAYERTRSLFDHSDLAGLGNPDEVEKQLLMPFIEQGILNKDVLEGDGFYNHIPLNTDPLLTSRRQTTRIARAFFKKAGWSVIGGKMIDKTGNPVILSVLCRNLEEERLALAFKDNLKLLGIDVLIKTPDSATWQGLVDGYDYDMMFYGWYSSLSPGTEQRLYWSSESSKRMGSRNYAGVESKAVDYFIEKIVSADNPIDFTVAVKGLDRSLQSTKAFIPLYFAKDDWVIWKKDLHFPAYYPMYGSVSVFDTWWKE